MTKRTQTKKVKVGNVSIGGNNNVVIQSMTNTKTSDTTDTLKQIKQLYDAGCKLVRVAIVDNKDLLSLKTLVQKSLLPIIADIHFKYQYAIQAIKAGVAAIRINPGNLGGLNNFKKVITEAKKHHCAIRIGINTGSLPTSIKTNKQIIDLMKQYVSIAEKNNFKDLVLS
ncbi:MAG: flavodoxin-dependent (E)-4-hydroxy-3-methylbut-2-enyl-diphosphate synthase, partial [Malacoplasma sp.]|nr:flavodoxin-dependent (E)-4-hydroxy-3-methylbut-2-enyl-diphosphate synthase [Malacoplasma sp.]